MPLSAESCQWEKAQDRGHRAKGNLQGQKEKGRTPHGRTCTAHGRTQHPHGALCTVHCALCTGAYGTYAIQSISTRSPGAGSAAA